MVENVTITNYCNECKKETNHLVKKEYRIKPYSDDYQYESIYQIVECCGCSYVSFRRINVDYENCDYNDEGKPIPYVVKQQYPITLKEHTDLDYPELFNVPDNVVKVYKNTLNSYANDAKILAGVGLRACIEAVCSNLGIQGKLHEQISILHQRGFITEQNAIWLNGIRFLGNESAHQMKQPDDSEFNVALRIVKHLFENVYILPEISESKLKLAKPNISNYEDFLDILLKNVKPLIENANKGFGLYKLLGDDFDRCKEKISDFEKQLNHDIKIGKFKSLKIGEVRKNKNKDIQLYHVVYLE